MARFRKEEMEAAISASQGAMRSLPGKLESLLSGTEYGLRAEEKNKIRILQAELQEIIDNYLLEPSEVESPALTASSWMMDLRDLSYDIDDFIYELAHVCGGGDRINVVRKPPRIKISRFPERLKRRQWITEEISGFRIRVKEGIEWHKEYLGNCKWRPSSSIRLGEVPQSPCSEAGIRLVGLISSIEQLCGWLANDGRQPEHRVASIVGTGGVGKTTLAKEMYRKLGGQFECLAFVRTSRKPDTKVLLASILSQVQQHQLPDAPDVHELVHRINAHLQDKTYLIVIDDLWELSTWDIVNRALPKVRCCGRILTTTEVMVIAQKCCADNSKCMSANNEDNSIYIPSKIEDNYKYIIKKGPLCEDESRELFLSTAFGQQAESLPQRFKEVSDEIIKISGGLPLAVKLLASLLGHAADRNLEQWKYIKKSLGSGLTTNNSLEVINQVLTLGYDNLPHGLKACMLYLCMYEEDSVIFKDDLVKQWITEGFISALEGGDGVEVARSYFHELVNRGLIQPVDMDSNDEILSCSVHHMVLDFIRYKSIEENFSIAIDHSQTTMKLADKVRRLALHFGNVEGATPPAPSCMRLSKIRSLAFSGFLKSMPSIVEFRFLQVLVLKLWADPNNRSDSLTGSNDLSDNLTEPDDLSYNLTEISQLFRLRYFRLDACHLSVELPTQMQRLKDLMVWEIDADVTSVPSDIVDLPGLFYVSLPSKAYLPTGIGRMTSLRTLGVIDLSKNSTGNVMSLGELTNLQDLRLTCSILQRVNLKKNLECLGSIIRKLSNLRYVILVPAVSSHVNTQDDASASSMSISWHGFSMVPLPPALLQRLELSRRCCIFSSLPGWTKELTKLCILKIAIRKVSSEDVIVLKGLPSLTALSLFVWTVPVRRIMFDDEGFLVLKYFKFVCAAPCLEFLDGAMTNVRILKLGFNANRMERYSLADSGFERLTSLNEISTKIGVAYADEYKRRSAKAVLTATISRHPTYPVINVQWVDWNFSGDDEKYMEAQKEIWNQTPKREDVVEEESSDELGIQEKSLEGDVKKQPDMRTYEPPESTSHMQTTGGGASGTRKKPYTGTEGDEQASDRTKGLKVAGASQQKAAGEASESGSKEVDQDRVIAHKVQVTEKEEVLDALGAKEEAENFQLVSEVQDLLSDSGEDVAPKLYNPGNLKLPLIVKHTSGISEKREVESEYGDVYKVKTSSIEGGIVALYFSASWCPPCRRFTPKLIEAYKELASHGKSFEVVFVSGDQDEEAFNAYFAKMPWLAVPFSDSEGRKGLDERFEVRGIPHLVILDAKTGEVLTGDGVEFVSEYGIEAYPFTTERINELKEQEEAAKANQTIHSVLGTPDRDYVPVSELAGKTVLLYFSAKWCGPCRAFLPTLVDVYNKIKEKNSDFEIVFVSSDRDQSSFDDFFSGMPWLALPLGDERKAYLSKMFKIRGIPSLVAIGPDGKTVNTDAKAPIAVHGAEAFPFTEERLQELEKKFEEMGKAWPEKLKHELHEHELVLTRRPRPYGCDGCDEMGTSWSYACAECDFDLHTSCALGEEKKGEEEKVQDAAEAAPAGYVCEGDVCRKA